MWLVSIRRSGKLTNTHCTRNEHKLGIHQLTVWGWQPYEPIRSNNPLSPPERPPPLGRGGGRFGALPPPRSCRLPAIPLICKPFPALEGVSRSSIGVPLALSRPGLSDLSRSTRSLSSSLSNRSRSRSRSLSRLVCSRLLCSRLSYVRPRSRSRSRSLLSSLLSGSLLSRSRRAPPWRGSSTSIALLRGPVGGRRSLGVPFDFEAGGGVLRRGFLCARGAVGMGLFDERDAIDAWGEARGGFERELIGEGMSLSEREGLRRTLLEFILVIWLFVRSSSSLVVPRATLRYRSVE